MENKKKKKIFSLLIGFLLMIFGSLVVATRYVPFLDNILKSCYSYICFTNGNWAFFVSGAFFILCGIFVLLVRRKKPFSLILVPYCYFIYFTVLALFHNITKNSEPVIVMSRVSQRPSLIYLCIILEILLFLIFLHINFY